MDNDAKMLRCFALAHNVSMLAYNGKRDPEKISNVLQFIQNDQHWEYRLTMPVALDTSHIREELILWQQFDKKFFPDVNVGNYTNLRMPKFVPGFNWPIVNARGISTNQLVERMRKEFKVWTYTDDLDSIRSDRASVSLSYIVLVRERTEADEELKNKKAFIIAEESIPCATLPEHLRLQFFHWWKTGQHLDLKNLTLCVGSRCSGGGTPRVHWHGGYGELSVSRCFADYRHDNLRPRAVSV